MDPFVRRLIRRLHDASRPLSRNRHFDTFQTPEGKAALKTSRRLWSLRRDLLACREEGGAARITRTPGRPGSPGELRVELRLERVKGRRTSHLVLAEFELLTELPGVREALDPPVSRTG